MLGRFLAKQEKKRGISIIEMLVVIFIIGLVVALGIVNYRTGQNNYILSQASQKLISDLRRVQNMAMNGVKVAGQCDDNNLCNGYGIYFDKNPDTNDRYLIYGNKAGVGNAKYQSGTDKGIETIYLPSKIKISGLKLEAASTINFSVLFKPPLPTTHIEDPPGKISASITLIVEGTSSTKVVNVYDTGRIQSD